MAALSILIEASVQVGKRQAVTVLAKETGRSSWSLQLQGEGRAWIKLGGPAAVGDGFRISNNQIFRGNAELGEFANTWEGAVSVYYEGRGTDMSGTHPQSALIHVISLG